MTKHRIASPENWLAERRQLLEKEKAFTKLRDELSRARRDLPWERVDKDYKFETVRGAETLDDLFRHRSQLVVYHFMFGPDADVGCKACSFWADNFNGIIPHLNQRDVSMVAISRAPLAKLQAFRQRLGWSFDWVSSAGSDFNYDYHCSYRPEQANTAMHNYAPKTSSLSDHAGVSVFYRDEEGSVFHTYSCYARGLDMLNTAYHYLDLVPKGRDEDNLAFSWSWMNFRDLYVP
jgi:predicted dithiol-disulfide oxidoreductase (DUF899 family)